jgi:hypothetical protein
MIPGPPPVTTIQPLAAEFHPHPVDQLVGRRARRPEHRDFSPQPEGLEHLEGVAQLLERPQNDLQVPAGRLVADELVGDFFDFLDQRIGGDRLEFDRLRCREHVGLSEIGPRLRHFIGH